VGGIRRGALCAVLKDVFKVLGQFLVVMSRHKRKKENSSYQFMSANSLRATVEQLVDFSRLEFFFSGDTYKPECTMLQLKMQRPVTNPFLLPVAPFVTAPSPPENVL